MGIAANLFFNTDDSENCLDWRVRPSDEQYDTQKERWNDLAEHLKQDLAKRSDCRISSWLQGSYKFGTQIRPARSALRIDADARPSSILITVLVADAFDNLDRNQFSGDDEFLRFQNRVQTERRFRVSKSSK
jgi:hypothetical protein